MATCLPPSGRGVDAVLDTDVTNEVDDQFAIVWAALRHDRFRDLTFTACPYALGPELLDSPGVVRELHRATLLRQMEGVARESVPRVTPAEGVDRAEADLRVALRVLGQGGAGRVHGGARTFMSAPREPVDSPAARHIVERARAATPQDPLWVLGIGCATNIASALLIDPGITDRVVVVWTSAHPTFWTEPDASYNLGLDLHATRVLFGSGARTVYVPGYYVGEKLRITEHDLAAEIEPHGPVGAWLAASYREHPMVVRGPGRSRVIWDLAVPAWVVEPGWFTTRVVPAPLLGPDLRWSHPGPHEVVEALDIERDEIFADLHRVLVRHAG